MGASAQDSGFEIEHSYDTSSRERSPKAKLKPASNTNAIIHSVDSGTACSLSRCLFLAIHKGEGKVRLLTVTKAKREHLTRGRSLGVIAPKFEVRAEQRGARQKILGGQASSKCGFRQPELPSASGGQSGGSLFGEGVKTRLKEHLMEVCNLHTIVRLPNSVFKPYATIGTNLVFFEKGEPTKEIWFYEHRVPDAQKAYSMTKPIRIEHLKPCLDWWGSGKRKGRVETEVTWKVTADEVKARNYNLDIKNPHVVEDNHGNPEELLTKLGESERQTAALRDHLKAILAETNQAR